ncbi:MAG TPA: hypothetical protein VF631_03265 [Allosphingosinicella sp.]|jgi:hypothetical protein|uniref:hypothetical protein n=1 Tax=Allosphingosinicella sp. TaxID=2823234 RepID=UPI002F2860A4
MTNSPARTLTTGVRTYRVSPWRRWALWYVLGPIIVGLMWLRADSGPIEGRAFLITAALVGCIGLACQVIFVDRATLQLSPDGACLRQTGYTLSAQWSDIVDIRLEPGREGFVTRNPMDGRGAGLLASLRGVAVPMGPSLYDAAQQELLAERRFIPIEAFAWHLRHGQMRQDIVHCAPRLAHLLLPR